MSSVTNLSIGLGNNCKNPSVIRWHDTDRWLFCGEVGTQFVNHSFYLDNHGDLAMFWMSNLTEDSFYTSYFDLRLGDHLPKKGIILPMAADCRLSVLADDNNNKIAVSYSYLPTESKVGFKIVERNSNSTKPLTVIQNAYPIFFNREAHNRPQKNWTPFVYNETVMLIQSVNPLRVVQVPSTALPNITLGEDNIGPLELDLYSEDVLRDLKWEYGHLRGGTNAVLLKKDLYLAFFHSSTQLRYSGGRVTYFFGAFTFSTESNPFRLLEVSPVPIIDELRYQNSWFMGHGRNVDYVPYPTSIFLENDFTLFLTCGHNDQAGFIYRMNLPLLLGSLEKIRGL